MARPAQNNPPVAPLAPQPAPGAEAPNLVGATPEGLGPVLDPADLDPSQLTPMMRQYLEVKAQNPDAILFFRLGDFYEMFFEDAVRASELLQITLTSRSKGADRVPMCGVPYHAARRYIAKLIGFGLKVAICDQAEEANGKGIVRREVTRIVTPGMVLDEEVLEAKENNFLASVAFGEHGVGASVLDASTGEFSCFQRPTAEEVGQELSRLEIRELLLPEGADPGALQALTSQMAKVPPTARLEGAAFEAARARTYLLRHFKVASLDGFGLSDSPLATGAAGAALRYLKETQRTEAAHVDRLAVSAASGNLVLDESTRLNLEVLRTVRDGSRKGSLLGVLDRTTTGMGARKLARWLVAPLCSLPEITARLDAVEELSQKGVLREELSSLLREVADLERLCGRLSLGAGNARDLLALGRSLALLPRVSAVVAQLRSSLLLGLLGPLGTLGELAAELSLAVAEEPPLTLRDGGLIRPGYHPELDELVQLSTHGKDYLLALELRERERTGISNLKVRYNKVFGYYLEVTRSNLGMVPKDWVRKQTTVGSERYITDELKTHEEKVLTAEEKRCALEIQLFEGLRAQVVERAGLIRAAAEAIATLDAGLSLGRCAAEYGYVRPVVDDSSEIEIQHGRHPVVERMLDRELFVPNDVRLDRQAAQILIVTGPNMAGKSTVMRQVALITLMAQAGSFVPARSARVGLVDRIFTRVGASDNLARGQSTFMVEMTETANILHHATRRSLVILDEIGRGTSTFDGLSIAWAVAEHLHDRIGARTLFATHYQELTDLAREKSRVKNCSIAVKEIDGRVVFLRKLVMGAANRSYGIEVARLAGLPPEVVGRAREILVNLESGELDEAGRPLPAHGRNYRMADNQLGLFAREQASPSDEAAKKLRVALEALSVDTTSPLEALNLLAQWKKQLGEG